MKALEISALNIYPLKSGAGIALETARLTPRGLADDRRWMVVNGEGHFITGREISTLPLVRAVPDENALHLSAPEMPPLRVPRAPPGTAGEAISIWGERWPGVDRGDAPARWLSRYLGADCRLVEMSDACVRAVDPRFAQPGDEVSFADGFPLLLTTEASLEDLNTRLQEPVPMSRFRPNLVVRGAAPYAEDGWRRLRIGEVALDAVKPCSRCVFTTVDPERGVRHPHQEPLRTLSTYRRRPAGGVIFGQNLIPRSAGMLRVGDRVTVQE